MIGLKRCWCVAVLFKLHLNTHWDLNQICWLDQLKMWFLMILAVYLDPPLLLLVFFEPILKMWLNIPNFDSNASYTDSRNVIGSSPLVANVLCTDSWRVKGSPISPQDVSSFSDEVPAEGNGERGIWLGNPTCPQARPWWRHHQGW